MTFKHHVQTKTTSGTRAFISIPCLASCEKGQSLWMLYQLVQTSVTTISDFPLPIQRWVESFLSNRTAGLAFNGEMQEVSPVSTRIPQGSPVSPIRFLIYLSAHFDKLDREYSDTKCPSYIDDLSLLVLGMSESAKSTPLQEMGATAEVWGETNALKLDNLKTELMHFHQNKVTDRNATVQMPVGTIIKPERVLR